MKFLKAVGTICLLFLLTSQDSFAQVDYVRPPKTRNENIIKFTPLRLIDIYNAGIEIGYEKRMSDNFSTQFTYTHIDVVTSLFYTVSDKINMKGARFSLEQKWFILESAPEKIYFSAELAYLNKTFDIIDNYYYVRGDKKAYNLNLKFGYQLMAGAFVFEAYAGLGFRSRNVRYYDQDGNYENNSYPDNAFLIQVLIDDEPGKASTLSFPINVKLGFSF